MHKKTKIFLSLGVLTLLVGVSTFFLSQIAMSKKQAIEQFVNACSKNTPFDPNWSVALKKVGINNLTQTLSDQYCNCFYDGLFDGMSEKQVIEYAKGSPKDREKMIGGRDTIIERDNRCLKKLKP